MFDDRRAKVAALAALLHDVGHGPFSHAFEGARKSVLEQRSADRTKAQSKQHEGWTADIIEDSSGQIHSILEREGLAKEVADLIRSDTPADMYHAVVSSSFDADRLDYIQRDRYMTGTGSAAIDLGWLLDNVRVASIDVSHAGADAGSAVYTHSFCLSYKAREAAEDFLLARYRLYTNVYLHKTTRGIEQIVSAIFRGIAASNDPGRLGLDDRHPLFAFLSMKGEELRDYLALDDTVVWGAIERLARGEDRELAILASRLLSREKPLVVDVQNHFPESKEQQRRAQHSLEAKFGKCLGRTIFKDEAKLTLYGEIGADDEKAQKRLMIQLADKELKEITDISDATIADSNRERRFLRYYFLGESDYREALRVIGGGK